jgi:hypothetical protein
VDDYRWLIRRFDNFNLRHIFKEANYCADVLTKAGCNQLIDFISFITPPSHVLEV